MPAQSLSQTFHRLATLQTHKISALPIVIMMPHSACNCRCVMCDIWKANKNLKQLTEKDVEQLMSSLKKFGTRQVVMSGGEALLHPNFFRFCAILKKESIKITLLSTGLTLKNHAGKLIEWVDDIIVSLDGNEEIHDSIRNVAGAFKKTREGVRHIKSIRPDYKITARTVIHRLNYSYWDLIIKSAKEMGLDRISFLPADVSSHAFNRELPWSIQRQHEIAIPEKELPVLRGIINDLFENNKMDFANHFIAEPPHKIQRIYEYYAAICGMHPFPYKKCNAPWVSTVIEADGTVRPCFFHDTIGNIHDQSLDSILNSRQAIHFRKELNISVHPTCIKCVCYLNLPVTANVAG
jgi:MoaA/NifB/PqqE/SkfB family radical SAM enzyme